jgi:hypothetical protein
VFPLPFFLLKVRRVRSRKRTLLCMSEPKRSLEVSLGLLGHSCFKVSVSRRFWIEKKFLGCVRDRENENSELKAKVGVCVYAALSIDVRKRARREGFFLSFGMFHSNSACLLVFFNFCVSYEPVFVFSACSFSLCVPIQPVPFQPACAYIVSTL